MYINYKNKGGIEYAMITTSVRKGGRVQKSQTKYLGRVIDKEQGIYKSRERGLFVYDLASDTYRSVPADFEEPYVQRKTKHPARPNYIVSFGDAYLLIVFLIKTGFLDAVDKIGYPNPDSLRALLLFYILCPHANCHAKDWWELTYAKQLFPKAQMASQRISELLADIGSEDAKRRFFSAYYKFLDKSRNAEVAESSYGVEDGVLIDSSGLPNSIQFSLTAANNHNGTISEELRLIYVVQQKTGLPLFFRYVAGNVIDVTTITRTIAELKANGINTKFAILDAGYYTGKNADALLDAGISFVSRMKSNFKVYKRIIKNHLEGLESRENLVRFNKRLLYVKCIPCHIGEREDRMAYAYLCKDLTMKHELERHLVERAEDEQMSGEAIYDSMREHGVFILISSRKVARDKLLPLYYTRDQVEKIFELCKQGGKILPINVESEKSLRGHLLMTFMAATVLKMMADKLKNTSLTTESMFMNLHEQHAVIYDEVIVTTEPTKKMNEAYKAFGIECPATILRGAK